MTESLPHAQDFAPADAYAGEMKFSRSDWQDVFDAAAWVMAGFLVLALVNLGRSALGGAVPPALPPNPQIVRQPGPVHGDVAGGARSAQVTRTRRD
jgi:hypothetical protein